jgi:hypothetical protein
LPGSARAVPYGTPPALACGSRLNGVGPFALDSTAGSFQNEADP